MGIISNYNKPSRKDDIRLLSIIIAVFIFVVWLFTPPGNKFMEMCFYGNHVKYFFAKLSGDSTNSEYIFHRNNAIYIAKMYKGKNAKKAISEMDEAIKTMPAYVSDTELKTLYKDRAYIKLYVGDYKGALNDFLHSGNIEFNDNLKVAMLLKENGNYKDALSYCNAILDKDPTAYAGFACVADLYSSLKRYDVAIKVWDLLIDRKKNNPRAYMDRAKLKKAMGDMNGYASDVKLAKEYSPSIDENDSIIYEALHPKILALPIR